MQKSCTNLVSRANCVLKGGAKKICVVWWTLVKTMKYFFVNFINNLLVISFLITECRHQYKICWKERRYEADIILRGIHMRKRANFNYELNQTDLFSRTLFNDSLQYFRINICIVNADHLAKKNVWFFLYTQRRGG